MESRSESSMSNVVYTNLSDAYDGYQNLIDDAARTYSVLNYEKREYISLMRQFYRDRHNASPSNYLYMAERDFIYYLHGEYIEEDIAHWIYNKALKIEPESLFTVHSYLTFRAELRK
jgi:phosphate uptake regulator